VGRYQEALHAVQRIKDPNSRAWALVWSLIRISRQLREGSPCNSPQPSSSPKARGAASWLGICVSIVFIA
jgi:hypothetical protein